LRVQLVQFHEAVRSQNHVYVAPHDVLCNVYNTACITGPTFVTEMNSRVSYHQKNPALNDEFKLRLPDVVTPLHWLKFTVVHMHVKPTAQRASLLGGIMRSSVEVKDKSSTDVGVGFLPLLPNNDALLEDTEHVVRIFGSPDMEISNNGGGSVVERNSMHNITASMAVAAG
jgi:hypothetical protein